MTTDPVTVKDRRLVAAGEAIPLVSGEVHYWRLQTGQWPAVLQAVKDLGLDLISTYVPWQHHEIEPGVFDFRGQTWPSRNLQGFLKLVAEMGLRVLFRPGPYIYSEWRNAGIPDRLVVHHRADPAFLKESRTYLNEVYRVVEPFLATKGGPIIMVQADNELDPWDHIYTGQLGLLGGDGPFQEYLRKRYGTVEQLNDEWGTGFASFEPVHATTSDPGGGPQARTRYLDFVRFRREYTTELATRLCAMFREVGFDVPLYMNTYDTVTVQDWPSLDRAADAVGYDIYPTAHFKHRPNDHRNYMEMARYASSVCRLPFIAELECGVWHGWHYHTHVLDAKQLRLTVCSALAGGVVGWNWYMLVDRDNWYMSPLNEWGARRSELAREIEALVKLHGHMDPPSLNRVTSTCLTWSSIQRSAKLEDPGSLPRRAMYEAGLDYDFLDLDVGTVRRPLILYDGGDWLPKTEQERLLECVEEGGHLVFFQKLPRLGADFRPLNLLGLPQPSGMTCSQWLEATLGTGNVRVKSTALLWGAESWEPLWAETAMRPDDQIGADMERHIRLPVGRRLIVGRTRERGKGRITIAGLEPSASLVRALHVGSDVPLPPHASEPGVTVGTLQGPSTLFVIVVNVSDAARTARITLPPSLVTGSGAVATRLLGEGHQDLFTSDSTPRLTVSLDAYDATVVRISPSAS
jgi:beta-galactosidase